MSSSYPIKPMPFRVVKRLVINDFKKTQSRFSDHAVKCYTEYFKQCKTVDHLINIISSMKDRKRIEAYDLLLDLITTE